MIQYVFVVRKTWDCFCAGEKELGWRNHWSHTKVPTCLCPIFAWSYMGACGSKLVLRKPSPQLRKQSVKRKSIKVPSGAHLALHVLTDFNLHVCGGFSCRRAAWDNLAKLILLEWCFQISRLPKANCEKKTMLETTLMHQDQNKKIKTCRICILYHVFLCSTCRRTENLSGACCTIVENHIKGIPGRAMYITASLILAF